MSSFLVIYDTTLATTPALLEQLYKALDGYTGCYAANAQELMLQLGRLDPENVILLSEELSLELFKHAGDFSEIAYSIRQDKVLGQQRRILVAPSPQNIDSERFSEALTRLVEVL